MTPHEITLSLCLDPARACPMVAPPVEYARPPCCSSCGALSVDGDRVILEGHGVRLRPVVVVRALETGLGLVRDRSWTRRFRCRLCGRSEQVAPRGVLTGLLYSVRAILWVLMHLRCIGLAVPQPALQDTAAAGDPTQSPPRRHRSPERWVRLLGRFWPYAQGSDAGPWSARAFRTLLELARRAGSWDFVPMCTAAILAHHERSRGVVFA